MMHICGGLVGPKSENVENPLVFVCFFEGQRSEEESKSAKKYPSRTVWEGVGGGQTLPLGDWFGGFGRFGGFGAGSKHLHA